MSLSSHVLDATTGRPAEGVALRLWRRSGDAWEQVRDGRTDADGRVAGWPLEAGTHRLVFETGEWWRRDGTASFHPEVVVTFVVTDPSRGHHGPLLLSPFSYTTDRGS